MAKLFLSKKANLIFGASLTTGILMLLGFLMRSQLGFGKIFTIMMLITNGVAMAYNVNCLEFGGCGLWSTILTIFIMLGLLGSLGGAIWMMLGKGDAVAPVVEAPSVATEAFAIGNGVRRALGMPCRCGGRPCKCGGRGW